MNTNSELPATQPPLAIVGLSALFPKAASVDEFWSNIRRGVDAITEVPSTHWNPDDYFDQNQKTPDMTYARRGGFLSPVPFDPLEFGISPNNLEAIDTSQLLGLVGAKRALDHAGYGGGRVFDRSRVGCILGVTGTLELVIPLGARLGHPHWRKALKDAGVPDDVAEDVVNRISQSYVPWQENSFPGLLGNVVAGRIANRLDLHGTNCVVDAACASSLSAIHLAALELWTGRSDMVVTGGIDTFNDIFMFMCFSKTPALSASGNAKPFSDEADGTILGEGIGMIVLKRLADAERDGDRIYAVLKGIGTSSDGAGNAVYAPKAEGQIRCLQDAYRVAGVGPETIELVEAHGTGTKVGDATEVSGLMHVYQATGRRGAWCAVGSVKSQIGHTKAAAGAAGIIKAILALQHKVLPPTIKVNQPPAAMLASNSPFYVNTEARPWLKPRGYPRRAAVSAFGFGGSNFHCVLEESPQTFDEPEWDGDVQVIALSSDSLSNLSNAIRSSVGGLASSEWRDVRTMAKLSRDGFRVEHPHRVLFVVERDKSDLAKLVASALTMMERYPDRQSWSTPDGAHYGRGERSGKLGILFPGQGSQYVGMQRELVCRFPAMLEVLENANEVFLAASSGNGPAKPLNDFIYPHPSFSAEGRDAQELDLRATQIAQPAIGAVSLAMLAVLDQFGVRPEAVAGHSYGELTALCASRRFSPQVLYRLSTLRGRLMAEAQQIEGGMLAVLAPLAQIEAAIDEMSLDLVVANHNSPTQVVLSGRIPDIDRAASLFASRNIRGKKLPVAAAFHSPLVAVASNEFRPVLDEVEFVPSSMSVYANSTATTYPDEPAAARDLLASQLARPVHFVHEIEQMHADGVRTFLEVGPSGVLTGLVSSILDGREFRALAIDSSNGKRSGLIDLASALASLAASAHPIRWEQWDPKWNGAAEQGGAQRLRIPICGANYVKPRPAIPPRVISNWNRTNPDESVAAGVVPAVDQTRTANQGGTTMVETLPAVTTNEPSVPVTKTMDSTNIQKFAAADQTPSIAVARTAADANLLNTIRETLLALQRMQDETSRLHEQFLSGQEVALRTISGLAKKYLGDQQLPGGEQPAWAAAVAAPAEQHRALPAADQQRSYFAPEPEQNVPAISWARELDEAARLDRPQTSSPVATPEVVATPVVAAAPVAAPVAPAPTVVSPLAGTVLAVVSEKTGYPIEMLNLEMSLDHDLGIDSIKRVEILSALQERVTDLPAFQPEELGSLHTLRDVVALADARMATVAPSTRTGSVAQRPSVPAVTEPAALPTAHVPSVAVVSSPVSPSVVPSSSLGGTVLAVVSEKTGYPVEMLNLEMSLDHDLGIDSIKRVEILSALQERVPHLPAFQPEELGALHTLRDVVQIADARSAASPAKVDAAAGAVHTLRTLNELSQPAVMPVFASPVVTDAAPKSSSLAATVLDVVSEKTGYPTEMLHLEMSLDHDLGIDSIKRVEILSALQERVPHLPAFQPEELGALHTLRDVVTLADARANVSTASSATSESVAPANRPLATAEMVNATAAPARFDAAPAPTSVLAPAKSTSLAATVLDVVSEKTGYPTEMLNLEMSLDHDLGIDSIKRVEILSALQERVPHLPAFQPEELGALHTLRDVVTLADARAPGALPAAASPALPVSAPRAAVTAASLPSVQDPAITRSVVRPVAISPAATRPSLKLYPGSEIWITEDGLGLSLLIADELTELGLKPRIINLDEPQAAVVPDGLTGLIMIAPERGMNERQLWNAVEWLQKVGPKLRRLAASSPAIIATVSRLDGHFGFEGRRRLQDPLSGGLAGLAKCAKLEWPEVTARAFDLAQEWSAPHVAAKMLVTELLHEGPVEVGLTPSGPFALEVVEEPLAGQFETPPLRQGEVVVISGGARGVTAEAALAIARTWHPHLVVLGRSPEPVPEPDWLARLSTETEIKQNLISRAATGTTPRAIANQYQQIVAGREVTQQLQRFRAVGVSVIYQSVDIRDPLAIRPLLAGIRRDLGPIRGIIHGAGVLADQRIEDKTREQFDRVYQTKVHGLRTLLDCVDPNELRMLGVFSSYTARFGRVGQLDYAIANEVLNKQARQFAVQHPDCRVASFNWGPWDGGMVQGGLKQIFASEGVGLIPLESGAEAVVRELRQTISRPVEVLILAATMPPGSQASSTSASPVGVSTRENFNVATAHPTGHSDGQVARMESATRATVAVGAIATGAQHVASSAPVFTETQAAPPADSMLGFKVAFERDLDVAHNSFLESHALGGKAVLPVAIILEWLAHGAIHGNPGLELRGFDDFRVYQGVRLGSHDLLHLKILCGKPIREEAYYKVPMRLIGHVNGRDVIHAGGNVVLSPGYPSAPAPMLHVAQLRPYSVDLDAAYDSRLFHGPRLKGIVAIEGCSEEGIVVAARLAPVASVWMAEPVRANWLADPLAIDSALQAVILWSQEMRGKPCLPCAITKYRQFRRALPHSGVRIIIRVHPAAEQLIRCEIEFVDQQGLLVARMEGCESVADTSLVAAFQRKRIEA